MNISSIYRRIMRAGIILGVALLALSGCSNNPLDSASPGAVNQSVQAETPQGTQPGAQGKLLGSGGLVRSLLSTVLKVEKMIVATVGGTLELIGPNNVTYRLYIPPDALLTNTLITMTAPDPSKAIVDFGPAGLHFAKSVRLEMLIDPSMSQTQIQGAPDVYWYNPGTGGWEGQNGTVVLFEDAPGGPKIGATADLNHFSRYAQGGDGRIDKAEYEQGWGEPVYYNSAGGSY